MTREDIINRLEALRALEVMDCHVAAVDADFLRISVLAAIADGAPNAQELAAAAMMTIDEGIGNIDRAISHGIAAQNKPG